MNKTLFLLLSFIVFCFATGKHGSSVKGLQIPPGVQGTILLVENFEYQRPANPGIDSTNYKNHDFPIMEKKYYSQREDNEKLAETFKKYKYKYILAEGSKFATSADLSDKTRFRFILKRKPESRYSIDKKGDTIYSDVYILYFNDRQTGTDYPGIEVNIKDYQKAMDTIIRKMNRMGER